MPHVDILGIGDSIAEGETGYHGPEDGGPAGNPASQCWPTLIAVLADPAYTTYYNAGVGGDHIDEVDGRIAALLAAYTPDRVYLHVGTNDAAGATPYINSFLGYLDAILAKCVAAGAELVVNTVLPRTGSATVKLLIKRFNGYIVQWCITNGVLCAYSSYADLEDPASPTNLLAAYDVGDGVHLSVAGYAQMGTSFASASVPVASDIPTDWRTAMAVIGIGGALVADTTLVAGTYRLTANYTPGAFNLTLDTTAGDIIIKSAGVWSVVISGAGTCTQIGPNSVHCTDVNDDSLGEVVPGSSGIPSAANHTSGWFRCSGANATSLVLTKGTCRYSTMTSTCGIGWAVTAPGRTISISHWRFYNCVLGAGGTAYTVFIGAGAAAGNGAITLIDVAIDSTNVCNTANGRGVGFNNSGVITISGLSYEATGAHGMAVSLYSTADNTHPISNVLVSAAVADGASTGAVAITQATAAITNVFNISNCIVSNTGTGDGIMCYRTNGTLNVSIINSIITACDGASAVGLNKNGTATVTHTYNTYYGNTADCFGALHATESTGVDPQLGNLPAGATIAAGFPISDGAAVLNPALEMTGSDTYDNLGIDESQYSATGYRYLGTQKITCGVQYQLSAFADNAIPIISPNVHDITKAFCRLMFSPLVQSGKAWVVCNTMGSGRAVWIAAWDAMDDTARPGDTAADTEMRQWLFKVFRSTIGVSVQGASAPVLPYMGGAGTRAILPREMLGEAVRYSQMV